MAAIIIPGILLILFALGILFANQKTLPPLLQIIRKGLVVAILAITPIYLGNLGYEKYKKYRVALEEQEEQIEYENNIAKTDSLLKIWIIGSWTKKPNWNDLYNNRYGYTFTNENTFFTDDGDTGTFKIDGCRLFFYSKSGDAEILQFNHNYISADVFKNDEWIFIKHPKGFRTDKQKFIQTSGN